MFGMESMSGAVKPLADVPEFTGLLLKFSNPVAGILAGTILTAIIQSSSASVGILQALCMTGAVPFSSAFPIIMGQNIGTCVTALLSAIGANKNAKRAADDPPVLQPDRNSCVHVTVLPYQYSGTFPIYDADGNTGNDRDHTQCLQYHSDGCMASIL